MCRFTLYVLLLLGLLLQGVVAVGAGTADADQQHCAGHYSDEACACCPDGADSMSCTVQCSVSQAPIAMLTVCRVASYSTCPSVAQASISSPAYTPLIPPPIA